jgi:SAM-dependent methyltransferase
VCGDCDYDIPFRKNGYPVFRCRGCGIGQIEPSGFDPESFYTIEFFQSGRSDGYADYGGSATVLRREFAATARRLARYVRQGGQLLEIGCAYGYFLEIARDRWQVHGLEISGDAVARCTAAGLDVYQGKAQWSSLVRFPSLDAVVILDVIEHLEDPFSVLADCLEKLRPGGVVYLSTGDFQSALARFMGKNWRLMIPPQHIWYFTPRAFERLAQSLGARIEAVLYPVKLVPLSLVIFQLFRMLHLPCNLKRWSKISRIGIPINLFDAMHVVLRKPA